MKAREILRFNLLYQGRRITPWLYSAVLGLIAFGAVRSNFLPDARRELFLLNSPYVIAAATVLSCLLWLLLGASVAGNAAARDMQSRMYPLMYSAPVKRSEHLWGRFGAAFLVNAMVLGAVPLGILLAIYAPGVEAEYVGPFRPLAHLSAYGLIALPTAFAATAVQFTLACLGRRAALSYLASVVLFMTAYVIAAGVAVGLQMRVLGRLIDPVGVVTIIGYFSDFWTPDQKNTLLPAFDGIVLLNRAVWVGLALLALTVARRGLEPAAMYRSARSRRRAAPVETTVTEAPRAITVPEVDTSFGFATRLRQTLATARRSFRTVVRGRGGAVLLLPIAAATALYMVWNLDFMGVPLVPRTDLVLTFLTASLGDPRSAWMIIPLLTVFFAGELVWRDREVGQSAISDAAPVTEWTLFAGKLIALACLLALWMSQLAIAGIVVQTGIGGAPVELDLYLKVLLGIQLTDYVLFGLLALATHVILGDKYVAYLVTLLAYGAIVLAPAVGIDHNLLVFASDPGWSYTDMRGFGSSMSGWAWFKLYWVAWAALLAVAARILWVRGPETRLRPRLDRAALRMTRVTRFAGGGALGLIVAVGAFILYATPFADARWVVPDAVEEVVEATEVEAVAPDAHPWLTATTLRVEIYPDSREATIDGTYSMVNASGAPIDAIHLTMAPGVETLGVSFDREGELQETDGSEPWSYALTAPLSPGDSITMDFEIRYAPRGFDDRGVDYWVVPNGSYFTNLDWLPVVGESRRPQPPIASDEGAPLQQWRPDVDRVAFHAVVGTAQDQTAIAPGVLRRSWEEDGRRYFEYVTDAPIVNEYAFFSADYEVSEAAWNDVLIQFYHQRGHGRNVEGMLEAAQASLDRYSEWFGPYQHKVLRFVERPGLGVGLHADAVNIGFEEGFALMDPSRDLRGLDLPYSVVAHEIAHQWWGTDLRPAFLPGAPVLSESIAQYAAMRVVESALGEPALERLRSFMRTETQVPPLRAGPPLFRAFGWFDAYRKGPFALYALGEYIGHDAVDRALQRLLEEHRNGTPPLPTSRDLIQALRAETPQEFQPLLLDLFVGNTFWDIEATGASSTETETGEWRVSVDVRVAKVVADQDGVESEVPTEDWVEVAVYAAGASASDPPQYLERHYVGEVEQTIDLVVPMRPSRVGVDPRFLLIDWDIDDNHVDVDTGS